MLPSDPKARKDVPLATGLLDYFPDALIAIARLSKKANERHNPGEPLHWSKGKSNDHEDCVIRHFMQRGEMDPEWNESHTVEMAWRALALLQTEIEAKRAGMTYKEYVEKLRREADKTGKVTMLSTLQQWQGGANPAPGKKVRYWMKGDHPLVHAGFFADSDDLEWHHRGSAGDIIYYEVL